MGLMGFPVGLMGVGAGRPQGNDAGLFQPAAASAETIRAEPSRAISFLSSAFSACSCPFSRAKSFICSSSTTRVPSDGVSASDPRNITPFPVISQSGFSSGNVSHIFDKTSLWMVVFLDRKRAIRPFETEIFCSKFLVLTPRYSINCFNLAFIVSKIS